MHSSLVPIHRGRDVFSRVVYQVALCVFRKDALTHRFSTSISPLNLPQDTSSSIITPEHRPHKKLAACSALVWDVESGTRQSVDPFCCKVQVRAPSVHNGL
jgi:hypothetical protein